MTAIDRSLIRDTILQMYAEARSYDLHYSTIRATLTTFVVTLGAGIAAAVFKDIPGGPSSRSFSWIVVSPIVAFVIAAFVSAHFQRLSYACAEAQKDLEALLLYVLRGEPLDEHVIAAVCLRRSVQDILDSRRARLRWVKADGAQVALWLIAVAYGLMAIYYTR